MKTFLLIQYLTLTLSLCCLSNLAIATDGNSKGGYILVQEMPEFPGGNDMINDFIKNEMQYPQEAIEKQIEGTVDVQFIVDKQGNVVDAKIVNSVHELLDKEALRIINSMPQWKPGETLDEALSVQLTISVEFTLQNNR